MKVMIKTELERAFKSWSLWLALIIGMGLSIAQIITRIIPAAMNPLMGYMPDNATLMPISAFQVWIGNGVSFEYSLFIRLIPILAAMPYAVTYLSDIKSGIIKNYVTRTAKFNYLAAKYIAVFVTGGVVVVMPLLINYLTAITILPCLMLSSREKNYGDTPVKDQAQLVFLNVIWWDNLYVEQRHIQDDFYLILPFPDPVRLLPK